jgi:hypothetical protein
MNSLSVPPILRLRLLSTFVSTLVLSLFLPLVVPIAGQANPLQKNPLQGAIAQTTDTAPTAPSTTAPTPTAPKVDAARNEALKQKALDILDLARKSQFEKIRAYATPALAQKLTAEDIKRIWEDLIKTTGPVKKVISSHAVNIVNADLVVINTQFKNEQGKFVFTFDSQGYFLGIDFPAVGSVDRIAKNVVQALAENDFVRARGYLSALLKTEIFPQQVQSKWKELLKSTGAFKKIKEITVVPGSMGNQTDVVLVTVEFAKITEDIFVIFDQNRRVVGIDVPEGVR